MLFNNWRQYLSFQIFKHMGPYNLLPWLWMFKRSIYYVRYLHILLFYFVRQKACQTFCYILSTCLNYMSLCIFPVVGIYCKLRTQSNLCMVPCLICCNTNWTFLWMHIKYLIKILLMLKLFYVRTSCADTVMK